MTAQQLANQTHLYIAFDASGDAYAYSTRPTKTEDGWESTGREPFLVNDYLDWESNREQRVIAPNYKASPYKHVKENWIGKTLIDIDGDPLTIKNVGYENEGYADSEDFPVIYLSDKEAYTLEDAFYLFRWEDGSVFGIK